MCNQTAPIPPALLALKESARRQREAVAVAAQEAAERAAAENWQQLVACVESDLGPDLMPFVRLERPPVHHFGGDRSDWRASILIPGHQRINALYSRFDGRWCRCCDGGAHGRRRWELEHKADVYDLGEALLESEIAPEGGREIPF